MYVDVGGSIGQVAVMVAAAGTIASTLPTQDAVLRGSMASQSLAADLANVVVDMGSVEAAQGPDVVGGVLGGVGGGIGGAGAKAVEVIILQTLAATIPVVVNKVLNSYGSRRQIQDLPKSPEISPGKPVHHRMDSPNSLDNVDATEDEDGLTLPSEDLNNISMNTEQLRGRGNRVLETLQKENQSRIIEERKLTKQIAKLEEDHKEALGNFKQEIEDMQNKKQRQNS